MNIFALSDCPQESARSLFDCHVVKMVVETAQLLASAQHILELGFHLNPLCPKLTHKNHPCAIWARESIANYNWLVQHLICLLHEYSFRYNKIHAMNKLPELMFINFDLRHKFPNPFNRTPFAQSMPEKYKLDNAIEAYRSYYATEKIKRSDGAIMMKYTNRKPPEWLSEIVKFETTTTYKAIV